MKLTRLVAIASFALVPLVLTASLSGQSPTQEPTVLEQEIRKIRLGGNRRRSRIGRFGSNGILCRGPGCQRSKQSDREWEGSCFDQGPSRDTRLRVVRMRRRGGRSIRRCRRTDGIGDGQA